MPKFALFHVNFKYFSRGTSPGPPSKVGRTTPELLPPGLVWRMPLEVTRTTEHSVTAVVGARDVWGFLLDPLSTTLKPGGSLLRCVIPVRFRQTDDSKVRGHNIPPALLGTMWRAFAGQFAEQHLLGQPGLLHPCNMTKPPQAVLPDHIGHVDVHPCQLTQRC